jgi:hypothetical protein
VYSFEGSVIVGKLFVIVLSFAVIASAADFEYNSGGTMGITPTAAGSSTGWGEWFVVAIHNDSGHDLVLKQLGFPCSGPATGNYGWVVWTDVGGLNAPSGDVSTSDSHGAFTPVVSDPSATPDTYTYIDVSSKNIVITSGKYFCIGYDNTGLGGQVAFNGVNTWSWFRSSWDGDQAWGRTDVMEVTADYDTALSRNSWGSIKASF